MVPFSNMSEKPTLFRVSYIIVNRQTVKKVTVNRQKWKILTVNRQLSQANLTVKYLLSRSITASNDGAK